MGTVIKWMLLLLVVVVVVVQVPPSGHSSHEGVSQGQ
jgi:hypothetical protein